MVRFAGVRDGKIKTISDTFFIQNNLQIIPIPLELNQISNQDLIEKYYVRNNIFIERTMTKSISDIKVAFITNWKQKCGISTYSERLVYELIKSVKNYKLFIEENKFPTGSNNNLREKILPEENFITCWKRGESLLNLSNSIKEYNPDVIIVQHEWGIFPNLRYWLALLTQLSSYRIIVVMHSVFYHLDKLIAEAAMKEIVVHLEGAKKVLKETKKISGEVTIIPHGCELPGTDGKLWNFYKSRNTFTQWGFAFEYKGWENSLKAVSILKNKYSDVFFTGILSESPFNMKEHQKYYDRLLEMTKELKIEENVGFIRGFQSEEVLDSILRTNTAAIFPYISHPAHEVFGASGAARGAMVKQLPVISSSVNHFSDLPTIKADTPKELAIELEKIFLSNEAEQNQISIQNRYLTENSWSEIAKKYINLILDNSLNINS